MRALRVLLTSTALLVGAGVTSCGGAPAPGTILIEAYELQGVEGRLLRMNTYQTPGACRIRYSGPKQTCELTVVVVGENGEVEARHSLGTATSGTAQQLDFVAYVSIDRVGPEDDRRHVLNARLAKASGENEWSTCPIDEWIPARFGAVSTSVPLGAPSIARADDQPVVVYSAKFVEGNARKTILVELSLR